MKCPHCGIHYDDSDRECPMCGTRKPAFQTDKSYLAKSSGKLARPQKKAGKTSWVGEYITQTCAHPKNRDCPHTVTLNGKKQKKKKSGKLLWIVILIILLANVLPALFGVVSRVLGEISADVSRISGYTPAIPELHPNNNPYFFDEEYAPFPYGGVWTDVTGSFLLALSGQDATEYEDMLYDVMRDGYTESGSCFAYQIGPDEDWYFPAQFPAEEYSLWRLSFLPEAAEGEPPFPYSYAEDERGTLDVFQSRSNPDEVYFYSPYGDTNWMDGEESFPLLPEGGAAPALPAEPDFSPVAPASEPQPM